MMQRTYSCVEDFVLEAFDAVSEIARIDANLLEGVSYSQRDCWGEVNICN